MARRPVRYIVAGEVGVALGNGGGQENQVDFVNGVTTAITPMAFYETVMVGVIRPALLMVPWVR